MPSNRDITLKRPQPPAVGNSCPRQIPQPQQHQLTEIPPLKAVETEPQLHQNDTIQIRGRGRLKERLGLRADRSMSVD
jgi:hypothetical protein